MTIDSHSITRRSFLVWSGVMALQAFILPAAPAKDYQPKEIVSDLNAQTYILGIGRSGWQFIQAISSHPLCENCNPWGGFQTGMLEPGSDALMLALQSDIVILVGNNNTRLELARHALVDLDGILFTFPVGSAPLTQEVPPRANEFYFKQPSSVYPIQLLADMTLKMLDGILSHGIICLDYADIMVGRNGFGHIGQISLQPSPSEEGLIHLSNYAETLISSLQHPKFATLFFAFCDDEEGFPIDTISAYVECIYNMQAPYMDDMELFTTAVPTPQQHTMELTLLISGSRPNILS